MTPGLEPEALLDICVGQDIELLAIGNDFQWSGGEDFSWDKPLILRMSSSPFSATSEASGFENARKVLASFKARWERSPERAEPGRAPY
eukprot:2149825-Alexandrium_andersonii.AAC.1